jgi:hypothetical protein
MAALATRLRGWFRQNADHLLLVRLDSENGADEPLIAEDSYFRISLAVAYLARSRDWFTEHVPAVHTTVRLNFAGNADTAITTFVRPPASDGSAGVYRNYPLTPLLPYRGGTVELDAGLAISHGGNHMADVIEVLHDFSGLIGPPVAEAMGIAERVSTGVQKMFAPADGTTVLGLHESFVGGNPGANELRPGHLAVINTAQGAVDPSTLQIVDGQLLAAENGTVGPLSRRDYMVFRIDGRTERDDWRFARFEQLIREALGAFYRGEREGYVIVHNALMTEIYGCEDLTWPDRHRAAIAVCEQLEAITAKGRGATGTPIPDLGTMIRISAPSRDKVAGTFGARPLYSVMLTE